MKVLAEQLKGMMSKVRTAHGDLYTLKTYKDKKYPVKSLRIAEIQQEINKLKETHEVLCSIGAPEGHEHMSLNQ